MTYKIHISNRKYTEFKIVNSHTLDYSTNKLDIDPVKLKLFNQDIFEINDKGEINVLHSSIKSMPLIPGVLLIEDNKTYGKIKDKFLYKCIPDDKRIPEFLIPYKIKNTFSKKNNNKYVVFKFKNWDSKHPIGTLKNTLGNVDILDNFYEYQLYCKSLYASIQNFTKATMKILRKNSEDYFINKLIEKYHPEDRLDYEIVTIDSESCKDFDDGFSIIENEKTYKLSIYISNVSFWLDALNLWSSFSQRISTIYLPDRKRPMLPTILCDAICSLVEGNIRFAFTLDLIVDKESYDIIDTNIVNTIINVRSNLRYNTDKMRNNKVYKKTFELVYKLNRKYKYIDNLSTGHDLIAYLMIQMNYICAKKLLSYKTGIYRSAKMNNSVEIPKGIGSDLQKFLKMWYSFGGNYCSYNNIKGHDMLELDAYVHITSPIRRLVDLLTMIKLQDKLGLVKLSDSAYEFYDKWTSETSLAYINKTMRSIRKVQNDCSLLKKCSEDEDILNNIYEGFIFDKIYRNDALYQYMVYLPKLKMTNRFTSRYDKENHSMQKFKIYIFTDEDRLKKKIRVEIQ